MKFRKILFLTLILTVQIKANANFCAGNTAAASNTQPTVSSLLEIAKSSESLRKKLDNSSLYSPNALAQINQSKNRLIATKAWLEKNLSQISSEVGAQLLALYFGSTENLAAAELKLKNSRTDLFDQKYKLTFTKNKFAEIASDGDALNGIEASVNGSNVTLSLSSYGKYFSEIHAVGNPTVLKNQSVTYFETLKCVLNHISLEKKVGLSELALEGISLPINSNTKACGRLSIADLLPTRNSAFKDVRQRAVAKSIQSSIQNISDEEKKSINEIIEATGFTLNDLLILSVDDLSAQFFAGQNVNPNQVLNGINKFEKIITSSERKILQDNKQKDLFEKVIQIAIAGIEQAISCRNQLPAADIDLAEKILRRVALAHFSPTIAKNGLIVFGNKEHFKTDLSTVISKSVARLAKISSQMLIFWGYLPFEEKASYDNHLEKIITKIIDSNQSFTASIAPVTDEIQKRTHVKLTPLFFDSLSTVTKAAQQATQIVSPATRREDLTFNKSAIAKLFVGNISSLPEPFNYYVNRIITRKDWATQKQVWQKYKSEIQAHMKKNKYTCKPVGTGSMLVDVLKSIFSEAIFQKRVQPQNQVFSTNCDFTFKFAQHLGLENTSEPKKLGDVWWSFKKHYSEKDQKNFEVNYREWLKAIAMGNFPVLDVSIAEVGLQKVFPKDKYLYSALTNKNTSLAQRANALHKALKVIDSNLSKDLTKVTSAKRLSDLDVYIKNSEGITELLGGALIDKYLPDLFSSENQSLGENTFSNIYQTHLQYQNKMQLQDKINYKINETAVSTTLIPFYWYGGAALTRFAAISIGGRAAIGSGLYFAGSSASSLIRGYFGATNIIFLGAIANMHAWEKSIDLDVTQIQNLKKSDYILFEGGAPALMTYEDYVGQKLNLKAERKEIRFQKNIYIGLSALTFALGSLDPILKKWASTQATRATTTTGKSRLDFIKKAKSYKKMREWSATTAIELDLRRVASSLKILGNPKFISVDVLQVAKNRSNHRLANEAYNRIVFQLGQRISYHVKNEEILKRFSTKLFGSPHRLHEVRELAVEFRRLFPDLVVGGL